MTQVVLAPCSPFSVTPELLMETAELACSYGVRLHTHLCETFDEELFTLELPAAAGSVDGDDGLAWRRRLVRPRRTRRRRRDP